MMRALVCVAMVAACGARSSLSDGTDGLSNDASTLPSDAIVASDAPHADGAVVQCDATKLQVLATPNFVATQIAIDDAFVYWAEADAILRVSKKIGGKPQTLGLRTVTPWPLMQVFALDEANVYFAADQLLRAPKNGGTSEPLGLMTTTALVALDSNGVYTWEWEGDGTLFRVPTGGGAPVVVTKALPPDTNTLVVDGDVAFGSSQQFGTFAVHLSDATIQRLDATESFSATIDSTFVYFTTGDHGPAGVNAVMRVPKSGGPAEQVSTAAYAFGIALDGDTLYFSDRLTGQILSLNKSGGPATVFETTTNETPLSIVVDERCVYWTNNLGGVMVAPK